VSLSIDLSKVATIDCSVESSKIEDSIHDKNCLNYDLRVKLKTIKM
jgi:hypothetical protein